MKEVTIIGNLGANAIRRVASDGKELMSFSVAVNSGNNVVTWFDCIGGMREKLFAYLVKGQCVSVIGDLSVGIYANRPTITINIDKIELCGRAPESTTANESQQAVPESFDADKQQGVIL